jgi:hypothetical protein
MKLFRCFLAILLVCGLSSFAKADQADFHMGVLDPDPQLDYTLVTGAPFTVTFGACPANITADGCFTGYNDTNGIISTLDMTFTNTPALGSQPATCDTDVPGSLFGAASCNLVDNVYILDFSGGSGIGSGQFFFITETGVPADDFPTGDATVTITPEPESLALFSTGLGMLGLSLARRRGSLLRVFKR